jgi:hypothetical protein
MSLGTILLIILVIALLGGFSGLGGGPSFRDERKQAFAVADAKGRGTTRDPLNPGAADPNQIMYWPPLALSVEPVMNPASSATRKTTHRADFLRLAEPAHWNER